MGYNPADLIVKNHKRYFRDYVWRHKITPYRILVAELMLNRTRAEQVEPVYISFIKKYPDIKALSKVKTADVDRYVKRLGLLWRSKHYRKAGVYILKNYNGIIPSSRESLEKIPGIGEYAAGAISTICFKQKEYVVDSNIARFIYRYYGLKIKGEMRRNTEVIELAGKLFSYRDTRKLLFAVLDFTALICKPGRPDCKRCMFKKCSSRSQFVTLK